MLVAGTTEERPAIQRVLDMLPADAYGQVLLEDDPDVPSRTLSAPSRVTVQRVSRLDEAVSTWVAEWLPHEPDPTRSVTIWLGARSGVPTDARCHDLRTLVELT